MVEKHINILNKYEEILGNIKDGNIIFGRSNRIKSIEVKMEKFNRQEQLKQLHAERKVKTEKKLIKQ